MTKDILLKANDIQYKIDKLNDFLVDFIQVHNYHGNETNIIKLENKSISYKQMGDEISKEIYDFQIVKIKQRINQLENQFKEL